MYIVDVNLDLVTGSICVEWKCVYNSYVCSELIVVSVLDEP